MATLTPTLTLSSTDMNGDVLNLSVTDSLEILGQVTTKQVSEYINFLTQDQQFLLNQGKNITQIVGDGEQGVSLQ